MCVESNSNAFSVTAPAVTAPAQPLATAKSAVHTKYLTALCPPTNAIFKVQSTPMYAQCYKESCHYMYIYLYTAETLAIGCSLIYMHASNYKLAKRLLLNVLV